MNRGDQMRSPLKARSRLESFRHAFAGLWYVLRTQRNAWIHAFVTVGVIFLGLWLQIELRDWAIIILAIFVVWLAEIINTALEAITDLASPEVHPLARVGKDVGAGAVLLASITAFVLGLLVLLPALKEKLSELGNI
jgi:diacylglycerol kinase